MPHRSLAVAWVLAWACSFPAVAAAQLETATIVGIVRDQSGAVVPKAVVTITNVQTSISVRTETDAEGGGRSEPRRSSSRSRRSCGVATARRLGCDFSSGGGVIETCYGRLWKNAASS